MFGIQWEKVKRMKNGTALFGFGGKCLKNCFCLFLLTHLHLIKTWDMQISCCCWFMWWGQQTAHSGCSPTHTSQCRAREDVKSFQIIHSNCQSSYADKTIKKENTWGGWKGRGTSVCPEQFSQSVKWHYIWLSWSCRHPLCCREMWCFFFSLMITLKQVRGKMSPLSWVLWNVVTRTH